jgi:hypothetical protein
MTKGDIDPLFAAQRLINSTYLIYFSFYTALVFISKGITGKKKIYLYAVAILCFFSIYLSATRGWIISMISISVLFVLIVLRKRVMQLVLPVVIFIVVLFILNSMQSSKIQMKNVLLRVSSVEKIITEQDYTAGGTLVRVTERSPRVMNKFYQSPFFGFGFSDEGHKYADGHVGNQNLLLISGVIGYFIFLFFWYSFNSRIFILIKRLSRNNSFKSALKITPFCFLGLFVIHSTSGQLFGYLVMKSPALLLVLFFSFANAQFQEALCREKELRNMLRAKNTKLK